MSTACVIPVRGGSKGFPRKNLAELVDGISLLEWTIDQALYCYPAEDVLVSTEDSEMAQIAESRKACVIPRPPELAQDQSTTASVVHHLLSEIDPNARRFKWITILQVTSPLRRTEDILRSQAMIAAETLDSVVSAYEIIDAHPAKMYFMESGVVTPVAPRYEFCRRQDLPRVFRRNGAIFAVTRSHFTKIGNLWGGRTGLVEMPRERSIDIDTPADLEAARRFLTQASPEVTGIVMQ